MTKPHSLIGRKGGGKERVSERSMGWRSNGIVNENEEMNWIGYFAGDIYLERVALWLD